MKTFGLKRDVLQSLRQLAARPFGRRRALPDVRFRFSRGPDVILKTIENAPGLALPCFVPMTFKTQQVLNQSRFKSRRLSTALPLNYCFKYAL